MPRALPIAVAAAASLALSACATTAYTGPVEVTRFVSPGPERAGLGSGTIAVTFPDTIANEAARTAFASAVGAELARLGYTVVAEGAPADQTAAIRTSRSPIAAAPPPEPALEALLAAAPRLPTRGPPARECTSAARRIGRR